MIAPFAADIADLASNADAAWFKAHVGRDARARPFIEGELPCSMPRGDGCAITVVRQIRPGVRARVPLYVGKMPADDDESVLALLRRLAGPAP